jgi:hypothetical protein
VTTYERYCKVNLREAKKLLKALEHFHITICNLNVGLDYAGDVGTAIDGMKNRIRKSKEFLDKKKIKGE